MRTRFLEENLLIRRRNSKIYSGPTGLHIVIPYWIGWPPFAFLAVWTASGARSAYENHLDVIAGSTDSSALARMYLGEAFVVIGVSVIVWMILSREVLTFRTDSITVCKRILGIGRCRTFAFSDVQDFRVGLSLDPRSQGKWNRNFVHACIVFEHRGKARTVGDKLRESEANEIVEAIRRHHPQLVLKNTSEA
jgi:hypothetical protein